MAPHSRVIRVKNRLMAGWEENHSGMGRKSPARRAASGLPAGTESKKTPATTTVPSVGWRK